MKKDINLLEGLNESEKKGNSSTTTLLIVIGIVAIIGIMIFMYVSTTNENKDKKAEIGKLDQQIALAPTIALKQAEYDALQATFITMSQEALKDLKSGQTPATTAKISANLFKIIYDNYLLKVNAGVDANGNANLPVFIEGLSITADNKMNITFKVKRSKDAWAFAEYLEGTLVVAPYEGEVLPDPALTKPIPPVDPGDPPLKPAEPGPTATPAEQAQYQADLKKYNEELPKYNEAKEKYEKDKPIYEEKMKEWNVQLDKYNAYLQDVSMSKFYEDNKEAIEHNALCFSDMTWPGLPPEGEGAEFTMEVTLSFTVNMEELAK